jgi:hypothetical protein
VATHSALILHQGINEHYLLQHENTNQDDAIVKFFVANNETVSVNSYLTAIREQEFAR